MAKSRERCACCGPCPDCGKNRRLRPFKSRALWNKGVGAVTKKEREGFTVMDVRRALHECKLAKWEAMGGMCDWCQKPITSPKEADWIRADPRGRTLTEMAWGRGVSYNSEDKKFDETPYSPDELRDEFDVRFITHLLMHRSCVKKRAGIASHAVGRGPVWRKLVEEYIEAGMPDSVAYQEAHKALKEKAIARMHELRGAADCNFDPETPYEEACRKADGDPPKPWQHKEPTGRAAKAASRKEGKGRKSTDAELEAQLAAIREEGAERPMTEDELSIYGPIPESYGG